VTTPAAVKKAMQQLTTIIVKAERGTTAEREQLQAEIRTQLDALLALHAALPPDPTNATRQHNAWFEQTVARARVILGDA
jgi:hypothetical protein